MARDTYIGAGTSLSSSYYMRNFYISNRDARTASKRKDMNNSTLSLADSQALRRAIKNLGSMDFTDENDSDIRNSVKAFIETYNNALSSTATSSDHTLNRNTKQLKSIAQEYASDFNKIGITVNDDGSLTRRDTLFTSASISKFKKIFSSNSDFMQRTSACAKRVERRSNALSLTEKNQALLKNASNPANEDSQASNDADLNALLDNGIGQNINIVL